MGENKPPVDRHEEKADRMTKQRMVCKAGIGGGLVGAAIGGLLGRRVGGVGGAVVGAVAGALVGKGTAARVNLTVESVVDAAKSVASAVNHNVNGVGSALKDTVEQVKPSVIGVVDALKDTVDEVKPSVVGAAQSVASTVNYNVTSVGSALKDTVERVKPSVVSVADTVKDTVDEVKPHVVGTVQTVDEAVNYSVPIVLDALKDTIEQLKLSLIGIEDVVKSLHDQVEPSVISVEEAIDRRPQVQPSALIVEEAIDRRPQVQPSALIVEEAIDRRPQVQPSALIVEEAIDRRPQVQPILIEETAKDTVEEIKIIGDRNSNLDERLLIEEHPLINHVKHRPKKIQKVTGIVAGIAATITLLGLTLGFSPKKQDGAKTSQSNQNLNATIETASRTGDGWIFVGNINHATTLVAKPLIAGSQFTDSPVVPSVGSIVTVTVEPGVKLRNNIPKEPHFNYQEQKVLSVVKPTEKLKVAKVKFVTPLPTTRRTTQVWAEVSRVR